MISFLDQQKEQFFEQKEKVSKLLEVEKRKKEEEEEKEKEKQEKQKQKKIELPPWARWIKFKTLFEISRRQRILQFAKSYSKFIYFVKKGHKKKMSSMQAALNKKGRKFAIIYARITKSNLFLTFKSQFMIEGLFGRPYENI